MSKNRSKNFIDNFIQSVKQASSNKDVKIAGFGTFINKVTPQRVGRNPKTGQEHIITERVKLTFTVSNKVKEQLN